MTRGVEDFIGSRKTGKLVQNGDNSRSLKNGSQSVGENGAIHGHGRKTKAVQTEYEERSFGMTKGACYCGGDR